MLSCGPMRNHPRMPRKGDPFIPALLMAVTCRHSFGGGGALLKLLRPLRMHLDGEEVLGLL